MFEKLKNVKTIDELIKLEQSNEIDKKYRMKVDLLHKIEFSISPSEIDLLIQNGEIENDFSFNKNISSFLKDPVSKLLFAISWKNGDLNKIRHIIYGIYNSKQKDIKNGNAIVFQQFGKFIADKNINPIIDQHVIRAYSAFKAKNEGEFINAQKQNVITKKHLHIVSDYINWLESEFFDSDLKINPEFKYLVDKILYGIGKTIKFKKNK
jgi:hypothetical protein